MVKSRVTVRDRPGKIYEAYLLDLSQYTGERKKRELDMIEFFKSGAEDELRRSKLIYEPSGGGDPRTADGEAPAVDAATR